MYISSFIRILFIVHLKKGRKKSYHLSTKNLKAIVSNVIEANKKSLVHVWVHKFKMCGTNTYAAKCTQFNNVKCGTLVLFEVRFYATKH